MPMPEMPDPYTYSEMTGTPLHSEDSLESYGQACYAAGKADALKELKLPNDGKVFWGGNTKFEFSDTEGWIDLESANKSLKGTPCDSITQCKMTLDQLRGELEEVK